VENYAHVLALFAEEITYVFTMDLTTNGSPKLKRHIVNASVYFDQGIIRRGLEQRSSPARTSTKCTVPSYGKLGPDAVPLYTFLGQEGRERATTSRDVRSAAADWHATGVDSLPQP